MSTSYWLDKSNSTNHNFDIVIVGAGIAGLSVAYWLEKENPSFKIAIVEKNRLGFGATGRNAGFITCGSVEHFNRLYEQHGNDEALKIWKFSEENLKLLKKEIIQDKANEIDFVQNGTFSLASTEKEFEELTQVHSLMSSLGIQTEKVEASDITKRLQATKFVGGIKYVDDAEVHPLKLLKQVASRLKAQIFEQHEVHNITTSGSARVVHTDLAKFQTDMVVLTTNGYSPTLKPFFNDKIFPTRGQILVTEAIEKFMEAPCYCNFVLDYFRQLPTGELIIGGFRQLEKESEVGYSDHITPVIQNSLEEFFRKHLPKFSNAKITHRWSGIMGFSADGQPLIGSLPDDPQVFFSGGFTAHGLGLAFHTGKALVDLLFDREVPGFISARRFSS